LILGSCTTYGEVMPQDGVIRVEDLLRSPALQLRPDRGRVRYIAAGRVGARERA
jgi:hypothetical protein